MRTPEADPTPCVLWGMDWLRHVHRKLVMQVRQREQLQQLCV